MVIRMGFSVRLSRVEGKSSNPMNKGDLTWMFSGFSLKTISLHNLSVSSETQTTSLRNVLHSSKTAQKGMKRCRRAHLMPTSSGSNLQVDVLQRFSFLNLKSQISDGRNKA